MQEYNPVSARVQAGLLFLATIGLLVPSMTSQADFTDGAAFIRKLSVGLAVLLIAAYGLGLLFSLKTHRELFASAEYGEAGEAPWPIGLALATLAGVTLLVPAEPATYLDQGRPLLLAATNKHARVRVYRRSCTAGLVLHFLPVPVVFWQYVWRAHRPATLRISPTAQNALVLLDGYYATTGTGFAANWQSLHGSR